MIFDPEWEDRKSTNLNVDLPAEWFEPPTEEQQSQHVIWKRSAVDDLPSEWFEPPTKEAIRDVAVRIQDNQILKEVWQERRRQDEVWGEQNWPDGTGRANWSERITPILPQQYTAHDVLKLARIAYDKAMEEQVTFQDIALEEIAEAFAETDPAKLRAELVQCCAVFVNWIGAIDRRKVEGDEDERGKDTESS